VRRGHSSAPNPARTTVELQQCLELIDRQAGLSDDRPQGPFRHLVVIGDGEASMTRIDLAKHDVATPLVIEHLADLLQRLDDFPARDARQETQRATSTISSEIGDGIGSEWAFRLSR
jgi:hypothetical protein